MVQTEIGKIRTFVLIHFAAAAFFGPMVAKTAFAYDHDSQAWLSLQAQGAFTEESPFGAYIEAAARASSDQKAVHERYFRPALTYRSQVGTFFLGNMVRYDKESEQVELRHWIQWSDSYEINGYRFGVRFRQEHRQLRGVEHAVFRSRIQLRAQHESVKIGQHIVPYLSQELLLNNNDSPPSVEAGLTQSRTGIGVNVAVVPNFAVDVGYLGVVSNLANRDDQLLHVLNLTLQYRY